MHPLLFCFVVPRDKPCYVCQAFANDLEERIHIRRYLTDVELPVVKQYSRCDEFPLVVLEGCVSGQAEWQWRLVRVAHSMAGY